MLTRVLPYCSRRTVCRFVSKLQVSDFGLSRPLNADSTALLNQNKGTLRALAPEAIPGGRRVLERGQPADVYA